LTTHRGARVIALTSTSSNSERLQTHLVQHGGCALKGCARRHVDDDLELDSLGTHGEI